MSLVRFGVSLEKDLLKRFDMHCRQNAYSNRSEAIRDMIREIIVEEEWTGSNAAVTGVISLVYDHHKRELVDKLLNIQHDHQRIIVASQHIHLDHDNCLEVIVVKGSSKDVQGLAAELRATKGVKHGELVRTTTGKDM